MEGDWPNSDSRPDFPLNRIKTSEYAVMATADDSRLDDLVWQRPVRALVGAGRVPELPRDGCPSAFRELQPVLHPLAAALIARLGLTPSAAAVMVDAQRERLRAGGLRRSDEVETLTAFVRLLVGHPLTTAQEVADIHEAYQHLRHCHWWPGGAEDLPLAAVLVAGASAPADVIARLIDLQAVLSESDEVPGDPAALVLLRLSTLGSDDTQVSLHLCALRTELLLSNLPLQVEDLAALPVLAAIALPPQQVMLEYRGVRRGSSTEEITAAVDLLMARHLPASLRALHHAILIIGAWMALRRPHHRPPAWSAGARI